MIESGFQNIKYVSQCAKAIQTNCTEYVLETDFRMSSLKL